MFGVFFLNLGSEGLLVVFEFNISDYGENKRGERAEIGLIF